MFEIKSITCSSPVYEEMLRVRTALLRNPLGLSFSKKELQEEKEDIFIICMDKTDQAVVGCCMLTQINEKTIRLRQMAVLEKYRKRGIGGRLLSFAEEKARLLGFDKMVLHARKEAVPFYKKFNYQVVGAFFIEVTLPHLKMEKRLKNTM